MYYRKLVEVQNIRLISKDSDSTAQGRFRESAFNKLPGDLYASDLWTTLGRTLSGCCSVTKLCLTLCNPMDCSISGFPVLHSLRVCSNSYPLSQWCHPIISSSVAPFPSCLQSFPASGLFQQSVLLIRWPKYLSFSFSITSFNEYSGLVSFGIDCLISL